jgi:hypothetical protein
MFRGGGKNVKCSKEEDILWHMRHKNAYRLSIEYRGHEQMELYHHLKVWGGEVSLCQDVDFLMWVIVVGASCFFFI